MLGGIFMEQWIVWLAIIIILTAIELLSVNLTTIWFVVSGIVALALSFITDNYFIQFAVFVVLGVILLVTTKPMLVNLIKQRKEKTNLDRVVGMEGVVTEKITKRENGEVKVDGKKWTAYADKAIKVGETIKVLELNGVKLKVEKKEGE
jgi:membrane protein implicated in regulation of membrane protease activity